MKKKNIFFIVQIVLSIFLISSCKKEIPNAPVPDTTTEPASLPAIVIGQSYGGGIVFYVDSTGHHGLIAAKSDQSTSALWFNGNYIEIPAKGIKIGTGQQNTSAIINYQGAGMYAASICNQLEVNGGSDWFLPSKDELNLLYFQKAAGRIGTFANNFYWSSTEDSPTGAWSQSFLNGANSSADKSGTYYVRAIRAF